VFCEAVFKDREIYGVEPLEQLVQRIHHDESDFIALYR